MYKQREKIIVLFSLLLLLGGVIPGQAQKDNRFEVSKNLDIFNALVKEVEMFYVDAGDGEKPVRRGIDAMLGGLDPYTEYYPEQEMDKLKFMTTGGNNPQNVREYLAYDRIAACGGSWMVKADLIKNGEFEKICNLTKEAKELAKSIRP